MLAVSLNPSRILFKPLNALQQNRYKVDNTPKETNNNQKCMHQCIRNKNTIETNPHARARTHTHTHTDTDTDTDTHTHTTNKTKPKKTRQTTAGAPSRVCRRGPVIAAFSVWCLGNGGMDPYSSPYIIPNNSPHNPFPHSLRRTRLKRLY